MKNVVLEIGENRRQTVKKAVEALGDEFIIKCRESERIFIHVNLIDNDIQLACTHIDAVRGLLDVIRERSGTPVVIGDAGYRGTKTAFVNFGYEQLSREYAHVNLADLNDDEIIEQIINLGQETLIIRRAKQACQKGLRISLAPMKTSVDCVASLSLESWAIGTWVVPPRISATGRVFTKSPWLTVADKYHQAVASLYKNQPCQVGVVDGILAMQGAGPVRGTRLEMDVVLAGFDPVAVDATAVTLMGFDPLSVEYLKLCHEQNSGMADMAKINVPPMLMAQCARRFDRS